MKQRRRVRSAVTAMALGQTDAVHYVWMGYRTGDRAAQEIAHSLRAARRPKTC